MEIKDVFFWKKRAEIKMMTDEYLHYHKNNAMFS